MAFEGPFEDRLAIRELLEAYSDAVCNVDADAWGATWAEDGVWELPDYPEIGKITGKNNIVVAWKAAMAGYPGIVFVATPGSIIVTGDTASSRSYTSEVFNDKDGVTNRHRGRYEDVLVKRAGKWLFKNRRFKNIHKEP
jgi:ketosteroid isomerase-like protein